MRLFQNSALYPSYVPRLRQLQRGSATFRQATDVFLHDRFGAPHILQPVYDNSGDAFFTNGDDEFAQRLWAGEQGLKPDTALEDILLAQVEHHRTEVFYNLDPMRYGDDFIAKLPGSVRRTVAWRAAPSAGGRFFNYDLVVNNFPSIAASFEQAGARVAYFSPAHDPVMDEYAENCDRPIDVLFIGTYSRHHRNRAALLEAVASLRKNFNIVMHLDRSRLTKLAETPLGLMGPLKDYRRNKDIRSVDRPPVFGRELLGIISSSKIVINGAIDMSGHERGNMRVWETLGCKAAMISDEGVYPQPMKKGEHFVTYENVHQAIAEITRLIECDNVRNEIASSGNKMIRAAFSKERQYLAFQSLIA